MDNLKSILVVIERGDETRLVLAKTRVLARHFGARLELFLCDAERAYMMRHSYDSRGTEAARSACVTDGRRYLETLRRTAVAEDLQIAVDAVCESPLYEGVLNKVLQSGPDLVVLSAELGNGGTGQGLSASAWQVIRTCPVPVMLIRGVPWHAEPHFASAVDMSDEETPGLARAILLMSEHLATGCKGRLEVLYSQRPGTNVGERQRTLLHNLAREFRVPDDQVHVLEGEPAANLSEFAADRGYDVLVLGALTHRETLAALVGTLTTKLVDSLRCDFILVKPGSYAAPVANTGGHLGAQRR